MNDAITVKHLLAFLGGWMLGLLVYNAGCFDIDLHLPSLRRKRKPEQRAPGTVAWATAGTWSVLWDALKELTGDRK